MDLAFRSKALRTYESRNTHSSYAVNFAPNSQLSSGLSLELLPVSHSRYSPLPAKITLSRALINKSAAYSTFIPAFNCPHLTRSQKNGPDHSLRPWFLGRASPIRSCLLPPTVRRFPDPGRSATQHRDRFAGQPKHARRHCSGAVRSRKARRRRQRSRHGSALGRRIPRIERNRQPRRQISRRKGSQGWSHQTCISGRRHFPRGL